MVVKQQDISGGSLISTSVRGYRPWCRQIFARKWTTFFFLKKSKYQWISIRWKYFQPPSQPRLDWKDHSTKFYSSFAWCSQYHLNVTIKSLTVQNITQVIQSWIFKWKVVGFFLFGVGFGFCFWSDLIQESGLWMMAYNYTNKLAQRKLMCGFLAC